MDIVIVMFFSGYGPGISSEEHKFINTQRSKIASYCHPDLYNNQINARALIGQSAMGYCAGKPTEKSQLGMLVEHEKNS